MSNIVMWISCGVIVLVFVYFFTEEYKLWNVNKVIKGLLGGSLTLDSINIAELSPLAESYGKAVNIDTPNGKKSNVPASEFINVYSVCQNNGLNMRLLDAASSVLVGLGLLGTFLGLTLGIKDFDSSNAEKINESIQTLLSGMGTAFLTSLFGMAGSIIFTLSDKICRHRLYRTLCGLTDMLDSVYYIDDIAVANINQHNIAVRLYNELKADIQEQTQIIADKLTYNNAEGNKVTLGNAIREILTENTKQSKALMSFSTDLAMELNQGFDETLSRQMQQKIVPLMESVDATTKAVVEHIDQMADSVSSPTANMMQSVADELKQSMQTIVKEFSTRLSGSATSELENLAMQLGTATQAMADFPKNMQDISATLQITIDEVKHAVSEITNTSANANSTAMQQMQEQIAFATAAIGNAIAEVNKVMSGISQSSQEQSSRMASRLADAAEKMGTFLTGTISTLSGSVQQSVKGIADDINSKQTDLIALQEDTTAQTRRLLESFNVGLERLEKMNEYVTGTMNAFKQAQGEITVSTGNLRTISSDMNFATELFNKGQADYTAKISLLQTSSMQGIDQIAELLRNSGQLSEEYVQKFIIITRSK